jgi:hypothetical protein
MTENYKSEAVIHANKSESSSNDKPQYEPNSKHRPPPIPEASQWDISVGEETDSFWHAWISGWRVETEAWGLHLPLGKPEYLGRGCNHTTRVFVAKFRGNTIPEVWHGYPMDRQDRPPDRRVVKLWKDEKLLSKRNTLLLVSGRLDKCTL